MTDLVFEFTSTAPEMEKAASAALKRLQESALKTATILSGAGKSSAKDLRKMVDEMEGAAGGSVEALSNMASRMEQRANSFRKNATDLKNTALGQAKALRDAAKQLQDAAAQIGAVNLPRNGASAASIKAFTDQFTSAAKQFESAVADVGSATANYIRLDKQFEDRLKKKKPKVDLGQDGMKEALKEVDKNADNINFRISQLAKWQAEYDVLYRKTYEKLGEGVSYKSIKADDLLPIDTLAEYKARGVQLGAIDKELWAERQSTVKLNTEVTRSQIAKQKAAEAEKLASHNSWIRGMQTGLSGWQSDVLREEQRFQKESASKQKAAEAEKLASHNSWIRGMQTSLSGWQSDVLREEQRFQKEQLRSREEFNRKMVAAATNTPAGDFQRYNASSGQAGRLVTVNGLANGPTAGEIATSTRQARDRADELARSLRGVTLEANTLHSASRGLASGFNMLWLTWGEMLPLLAGAAISFGTAFSVKMGAQVDHTLQTIRVLSGETQEAIAGLNDQLLQLASTGPVGPLEVAEAMKTLSLAGMSASGVSVAIKDVMNFAVAGTTDLKQAADVMTSVATAFNVSAEGFNYVGDVIAKTAAVSKASVESVGEAFKTASVIHKQFGVSLEDAGVGIAALANLGIQGTAAGTALRNMYNDLSGRTPKVTAALKQLNVELRDQSGKFKDLVTLTMEFDKGLSRLDGTAQKNALLTILSERGGKPMIELRELVIEEEKVAREFAKRSGQAVVEGFEEGVKNRLQRMRDSIGDSAGFQIMARIELSETPLKQMETAVSALQSSLVSAFSSVKSEASGVALALQDLFRSDSFRSNIESLLQLTLNLAGGLVSLTKFANENAGVLATLTAAYVGLRLAVGHSLELMTFYTKAQTLATTHSWAATAAVTAERVAQGPLAVQKAIATSATQADTLATWANTGAKYAAITASKLFAAALPYVGVVLAVATGAWMLYESVVGSSTQAMEDAANSTASERRIKELEAETARLNENTDAMLANMTVEQLRASRAIKADNSDTSLLRAERDRYAKQASELMDIFEKTNGGGSQQAAVVLQAQITKAINDTAKAETALTTALAAKDKASSKEQAALDANIAAAKKNAEVTKALQAARQSAAKTGTDKFLAEQQRQLSGLDRLGKEGTAQQAAQNKLDNDLRYNRLDEIAKANKTELDSLRSHLNSQTEALKDFRDANMVQEGEYQSRITSITLEGEKAQRAAAVEGLQAYAAEIGRLLNGLKAMPKSQISDNDKANRVQELNAKLLAKAEEFQSDMAKIDEEANKRERRLATDQYKELDKLRKANETAIANSKDRVQAIREEQAMADKTLGLGGADLEATQARLKIELEAKKELRKFDLESLDKIRASERLRADAELATDDETWEAKHRRADDFDAQMRILAKGRAEFETQTQTEVAETVAAVYRKESKRQTDELATTLSGALVDTLMNAGKEGGRNLRRTLEQELLAKPFRMVVQALIQPFAQQAAAGINNFLGVPGGAAGTVGTAANIYSMYGAAGKAGAFVGSLGSAATYGTSIGSQQGAMLAAQEIGMGTTAGSMAGAATTIASAVPYVAAFVAVASLLSSLDDSGTLHTGGLGSYSRAGGAASGNTVKSQGLKFGLASKDYQAQTEQASIAISATIASTLDATAEAFGQKTGYYAATGFADDSSKDGAWGALMVKLGDQTLIDWKDNDKWPGIGFADGEAGAKEYASAIGKDMRDYLVTQTPDWADSMLMALGKAPSLEGVVETAGKINAAATALEGMGRASAAFAGMAEGTASALIASMGGAESAVASLSGYYTNFYTESERAALATTALTGQLAELGKEMPASREAFRGLVDAAIAAGDTTLAAGLINLQDEFAALVPAANDAATAVSGVLSSLEEEGKRLKRQLIEAQGGDLVAFDTEGMTLAERAAYAYNQSVRAQTAALTDASDAAKRDVGLLTSYQDKYDIATGKTSQWDIDLRDALAQTTDQAVRDLIKKVFDLQRPQPNDTSSAGEVAQAVEASADTQALWLQSINDGIARVETATRESITALTDQLTAVRANTSQTVSALNSQASEFDRVAESMKSLMDSILGTTSAISPEDKLAQQRAEFESIAGKAMAGDMSAAALLPTAANALLNTSEQYGTSANDYARDQARAYSVASMVRGSAMSNASALYAQSASATASGSSLASSLETQLQQAQAKLANDLVVSQAYQSWAAQKASSAANWGYNAAAIQANPMYASAEQYAKANNLPALFDGPPIASSDYAAQAALAKKDAELDQLRQQILTWVSVMPAEDAEYAKSEWRKHDDYAAIKLRSDKLGLPFFDVGTDYVPRDMLAVVHRGEQIVPAPYNPHNQPGGKTDAALIAELSLLRAEVSALRAEARATAINTRRLADLTDTATDGGRAMLTEAYE